MVKDDRWLYFHEGGKHVLFSSPSKALKGRLLRVRREDLLDGSPRSRYNETKASVDYLRRVVHPLLNPYFDIPELVELSPRAARHLFNVALECGSIPESRLYLWKEALDSTEKASCSVFATMIDDYRQISIHDNRCFSIEIKPKAGYLAFSPLVHPMHRIKCEHSRFWIKQQLLQHGISKNGWSCSPIKPSNYNPLDLFSCDETRMKVALLALLENPQNNLTVWDEQGEVLGHGVQKLSHPDAQSILSVILLILSEENILTKLLDLQMLDVIDGDGAVMIYNHLLNISSFDQDHIHEMLEIPPEQIAANKGSGCLALSPFQRPVSVVLEEFLQLVENFPASTLTDEEKDALYIPSQDCVSRFTTEDCTFLLQNWLLSLAMCDVSILIALAPSDRGRSARPKIGQWLHKRCFHDENNLGLLESEGSNWMYKVKVVDCDNKPASKLRKRNEKESLVRQL